MLADKENHVFKPDARFDTAFELYKFDRILRLQILREIEKIEVAVRAKVIYICSHQFGPFWFMDPTHFHNPISHSKTLTHLSVEIDRSDEDFIKAFRNNYSDPMPPSWMTFEVASFGTLSRLYQNLKPGRTRRDVAHSFSLNDRVFMSWLHTLVYVRNVCAHHARLWNRTLGIIPEMPRQTRRQWLIDPQVNQRKLYFLLSMILYLHHTVDPHNTFAQKVMDLFGSHPNVDPGAMGFPANWRTEPLWQ
ncbi:MAG: Abi family protein [Bacteroidota bacterium]|nr:Abi family protein [Bacteroidota bacterium]